MSSALSIPLLTSLVYLEEYTRHKEYYSLMKMSSRGDSMMVTMHEVSNKTACSIATVWISSISKQWNYVPSTLDTHHQTWLGLTSVPIHGKVTRNLSWHRNTHATTYEAGAFLATAAPIDGSSNRHVFSECVSSNSWGWEREGTINHCVFKGDGKIEIAGTCSAAMVLIGLHLYKCVMNAGMKVL